MYPNSPQVSSASSSPYLINQEDEIDLKVILFNYLQFWPIILLFGFLGLLAGYLLNKFTTPIYKVESTVIVKDENASLGADLFASAGILGLQGKSNIENEIGIIKSFSLAQSTIEQMELNVQYFSDGLLRKQQLYGNVPIYVKVDWEKNQVVGGLFKLEVVDELNFQLSIEEENFHLILFIFVDFTDEQFWYQMLRQLTLIE
jgi:uncharacterized protein involved in exopolysaccharide biosynthesis